MNFGRTRNRQWGHIAVMALCFLVLGFSFAAKLSLYQPNSKQIHALASSKMWQHEVQDAAAVMAAPDDVNPISDFAADHSLLPLVTAFMATMLMALSGSERLERESPPTLPAVAFFSRRQLRAPPVR